MGKLYKLQQTDIDSILENAPGMLKSTHKSVAPPPLPEGWTEHKAPTGHSYYYNAATKQSTYTINTQNQNTTNPIEAQTSITNTIEKIEIAKLTSPDNKQTATFYYQEPEKYEGDSSISDVSVRNNDTNQTTSYNDRANPIYLFLIRSSFFFDWNSDHREA